MYKNSLKLIAELVRSNPNYIYPKTIDVIDKAINCTLVKDCGKVELSGIIKLINYLRYVLFGLMKKNVFCNQSNISIECGLVWSAHENCEIKIKLSNSTFRVEIKVSKATKRIAIYSRHV